MDFRTTMLTGLGATALVLALAIPGYADDKADLREFKTLWEGKNLQGDFKGKPHLAKREACESKMPTGYKDAVKDILDILNHEDWSYRITLLQRCVIEQGDSEMVKLYEEALSSPKETRASTLEHLVVGLCRNKDWWPKAENWTKLADLYKNSKWAMTKPADSKLPEPAHKVRVRIAREFGLAQGDQALLKHKFEQLLGMMDSVVPIMEKDKKGEARALWWSLSDALESLSSEDKISTDKDGKTNYAETARQWRFWFTNEIKNKEGAMLKPRKGESLNEKLGDVDLSGETFARPIPRQVEGMDVLVLPDLGRSGEYWKPVIFELNKIFNCIFVDLPDASGVKPEPRRPTDRAGNKDPNAYYYPLPQLVEAFERRRDSVGQKQVGLIAHGVSGWVALQYAQQKPESVAFVIVFDTWASGPSFSAGRNKCESNNNPYYKNYAKTLIYDPTNRQGPGSMSDEELWIANVAGTKLRHADPRAFEPIFYNSRDYNKQITGGNVLVPDDFSFPEKKNVKLNVPNLIVWGKHACLHHTEDQRTIGNAFQKPNVQIYENSARTPWAEEPIRFFDDVQKLIKDAKLTEKKNKKDK